MDADETLDRIESQRRLALISLFRDSFGNTPEFLIRAPGRVNLIGEHIDYHGYSVLPMALTQDIIMVVKSNKDGRIRLQNLASEKYGKFECAVEDFEIVKTKPLWYHYVLCGIRGIIEQLKDGQKPMGMDVVVDGNIPPNAGLSSSSALVCCSALVTATVNNLFFPPEALASICAKSERYIGTEGGGMDQAISFLAKRGKAKLIEFEPLRATDVTLPAEAVFVVANSCVELNKAATGHFNTRVAEGRVGVQILAKEKNLDWRKIKKAMDLQTRLKLSAMEMIQLVQENFKESPYTAEEVCLLLEITPEEFKKDCLTASTQSLGLFEIRKRLTHIFSEHDRVLSFQEVSSEFQERGDVPTNVLQKLGDLMFASHVSCRDDYECSCKDLDELVEVMMEAGAFGARLTGAGWGGCAVALIQQGKETQFLYDVQKNFFNRSQSRLAKLATSLFVTSPGDCAQVIRL